MPTFPGALLNNLFASRYSEHAPTSRAREGNAMQPLRRRFLRLACAAAALPVATIASPANLDPVTERLMAIMRAKMER